MLISEAPQISGLLTLEIDTKREESGPVANLRISGLADLEILSREKKERGRHLDQFSLAQLNPEPVVGTSPQNIDQKVAAVISHS
jgi:hypothetical protein